MKGIFLFSILIILCSCGASDIDIENNNVIPVDNNDNDEVNLIGMVVNSTTQTSFEISVEFSNDINENSVGIVYYCNETDAPNCDPKLGDSLLATKGSAEFTVNPINLNPAYSAGDSISFVFCVDDADGYLSPNELVSQVQLAP